MRGMRLKKCSSYTSRARALRVTLATAGLSATGNLVLSDQSTMQSKCQITPSMVEGSYGYRLRWLP